MCKVLIHILISAVTQGSKSPTSEKASPSSAAENTTTDLEQRSFLLLDEKENLQVHN